jgi:hypothetical protein
MRRATSGRLGNDACDLNELRFHRRAAYDIGGGAVRADWMQEAAR